MAMIDVNAIKNPDDAIEAVNEAVTASPEETRYSASTLHPEGEFSNVEIFDAKATDRFIIVEFLTNVDFITKFYSLNSTNGRTKLDPTIRYLLKAIGVSPNDFALSELIGKTVSSITIKHSYSEKTGETYANIYSIR